MKIFIIGLGNPDKEYNKSPHNLGFEVIDKLFKKNEFEDFQESMDKNYLISKGKIGKKSVFLVKPLTFMNNSGVAVKSLMKKFNLKRENVWVVHDEIDLPIEKMKITENKSSAGHKGVENIIKTIKSKIFTRFRIGSCPFNKKSSIKDIKKFLLVPYNPSKEKLVNKGVLKASKSIEVAVEKGIPTAMTMFNK